MSEQDAPHTRIGLGPNEWIEVSKDLQSVRQDLQSNMLSNTYVGYMDEDGKEMVINPFQVTYLKRTKIPDE